jgi:hypothetical protein
MCQRKDTSLPVIGWLAIHGHEMSVGFLFLPHIPAASLLVPSKVFSSLKTLGMYFKLYFSICFVPRFGIRAKPQAMVAPPALFRHTVQHVTPC